MKYTLLFLFAPILFATTTGFAQHIEKGCSHAKVPNQPFTRTEANEALSDYDVKFYGLDIEVDNLSTYLEANVTITAEVTSTTISEFVAELINDYSVDSIFIDDEKSSFTHINDEINIVLPRSYTQGELLTAIIYYHGTNTETGFFAGISNAVSSRWGNQVTWTLSESYNAKKWWPCKQALGDKADSAHIFITVPDHLMAGSNGILTGVYDVADSKKRFEWKTYYPIAYYLISIAVGEYEEYNTSADIAGDSPTPIINFIYNAPGCLEAFQADLDELDDQMLMFSALYGPYPFYKEKYGHSMAPFSGGMEHQTMTTQGYFEFGLNAHELGHQWFGDNVTCATWNHIWVNEGFARYSEYLAYENLRGETQAKAWISGEYQNVLSQSGGSVHVPEESVEDENRIFDFRLTYQKGGILVNMLRNVVDNDEQFFNALKNFQIKFADSVATADDFKEVLNEETEMDFNEFFDEWYYGEGYPLYDIDWGHYGDTLYINQYQSTSASTALFHTPLEYKISTNDGDSIIRLTQTQEEELFKIYFPVEEVTGLEVDPDRWLLKRILGLSRSIEEPVDPDPTPVIAGIGDIIPFNIRPNPSTGMFKIMPYNDERYSYRVYDLNGKVVSDNKAKQGVDIFDIKKEGVYILEYRSESTVRHERIIVRY